MNVVVWLMTAACAITTIVLLAWERSRSRRRALRRSWPTVKGAESDPNLD